MPQNALDSIAARYQDSNPDVPFDANERLKVASKQALVLPELPMKRTTNSPGITPRGFIQVPNYTPDQMTGRSTARVNKEITADPYGRKEGVGGFKPGVGLEKSGYNQELFGTGITPDMIRDVAGPLVMGKAASGAIGGIPEQGGGGAILNDPYQVQAQPNMQVPENVQSPNYQIRPLPGEPMKTVSSETGQSTSNWRMREKAPPTAQNSLGVRATNTIMDNEPLNSRAANEHALRANLAQEQAAQEARGRGAHILEQVYKDGQGALEPSKSAPPSSESTIPGSADTKVPLSVHLKTLPQEVQWLMQKYPNLGKTLAAGGATAGLIYELGHLAANLKGIPKEDK